MKSDSQLLAQFAQTRSEEAIAELVRRHVNLVYSAALRQVGGEAHLAQDVTQTVFADLARKAPSLAKRSNISGWLYTSARFAAAKVARSEHRRRDREEKFMREPNEAAPELDWENLRPVLDEMMHELKETDREAILLRYFENRPFSEIGACCGLNENAARMRVDRAVERLRGMLAKRGVATSSALASVISAQAVQVAPAGLTATLASNSFAVAGGGTAAFWNVLNGVKIKLGFAVLAVAGAAAALIVQNQARASLLVANGTLKQQIAQLKTDNEGLGKQVWKRPSLSSEQFDELLRLRGEVGMLREQTNEIPRLRQVNRNLLSEVSVKSIDDLSEGDKFILREDHALNAATILLEALKNYASGHNGQYPGSIGQLVASGAVGTTNLAGNLRPADFEIRDTNAAPPKLRRFILGLRVPIARPGRAPEMILGELNDSGIPMCSMWNWGFPDAGQ
jgi:RNA polymerase sigma factor (sigma-70 family)